MMWEGQSKLLRETRELYDKVINEENPTFELQRQYVDSHWKTFGNAACYYNIWYKFPIDKVLRETIEYMIDKEPKYLIAMPAKFITYDLCEKAIKNIKSSPGQLMKSIPIELYDYNLCKLIVTKNPILIKKFQQK